MDDYTWKLSGPVTLRSLLELEKQQWMLMMLMPLERDLITYAAELFNLQYVHPIVVLQDVSKLVTDEFVIDVNVRMEIEMMLPDVRVPRLMRQTVDLELVYKIPSAREEFVTIIRDMVMNIEIQLEHLNDSIQNFKNALKVNVSVQSPLFDFTQNTSMQGMLNTMSAMHYCAINRNLFVGNGINYEKEYCFSSDYGNVFWKNMMMSKVCDINRKNQYTVLYEGPATLIEDFETEKLFLLMR